MYNYRRDFAHDNCPSPLSTLPRVEKGRKDRGVGETEKNSGEREIVEYTEIRRVGGR